MPNTSSKSRQSVKGKKGSHPASPLGEQEIREITGRILAKFPKPIFRAGQQEAIEKISQAFLNGRTFVIVNAPVGSGKSAIAMTFARFYGSAHVLTGTKVLQSQYEREFSNESFTMRGKASYICLEPLKNGGRATCATGPCSHIKDIKLKHKPNCPYNCALNQAERAATTIHNYDSFYFQRNFGGTFAFPREIAIFDEAQFIEPKYLDFMSIDISTKQEKNLVIPEFKTVREYVPFISGYLDQINEFCAQMENLPVIPDSEFSRYEKYRELSPKLASFLRNKTFSYTLEFSNAGGFQEILLKPLFVSNDIKKDLFSSIVAKRFLFLSASVTDKSVFCRHNGIDENQAEFIEILSFFPAVNRPIYKSYAGPMSYAYIKSTLPKSMKYVEMILKKHQGEKGIIQTHSDQIMAQIKANIYDKRLLFRSDYLSAEELIADHENSTDSVIVASGLREGIDLKDDLSRFQIFMKVPYPPLGDARIKKLLELDRAWYSYTTAASFVQAYGRSIRSDKDTAVTYLLDSDFDKFFLYNKKYIPEYVLEAIQ